jgi:hypothetical protein
MIRSSLQKLAVLGLARWIELTDFRLLKQQARNPKDVQAETLNKILSQLANTKMGKQLRLSQISSYEKFKQQIPITNYEFYRDWIESDLKTGEGSISPSVPLYYVKTSGTTAKSKYIPVTERTLKLNKRAQRISSYAYTKNIPGAFSGKIFSITSPDRGEISEGGTNIGAMSGIIANSMPKFLKSIYVLPSWVLEIAEYNLKYKVMAAFALAERNISLFASANPTTFLRLFDTIEECHRELVDVVATGKLSVLDSSISHTLTANKIRAEEIKNSKIMPRNKRAAYLWPKLKGIVTWTSGNCSMSLTKVLERLPPSIGVAEMGYLSSEFRGTIPIDCGQCGAMPPIGDIFFEFAEESSWDSGSPEILRLDQLEAGKRYQIFATTGDGLFRYQINDLIEVAGKFQNSPLIQFIQKGKGVTNLTGEKLCEFQVLESMKEWSTQHKIAVPFFLVYADKDKMQYEILLEQTADFPNLSEVEFASIFDSLLGKFNCEYAEKRNSGRLKPLFCSFSPEGLEERVRIERIAEGQRENQLKICRLEYKKASGKVQGS